VDSVRAGEWNERKDGMKGRGETRDRPGLSVLTGLGACRDCANTLINVTHSSD